MSQYIEGNHKAFTMGTNTIGRYLRVKLSGTPPVLVVAAETDVEIGVLTRPALTASVPADVLLRTAAGTMPISTSTTRISISVMPRMRALRNRCMLCVIEVPCS